MSISLHFWCLTYYNPFPYCCYSPDTTKKDNKYYSNFIVLAAPTLPGVFLAQSDSFSWKRLTRGGCYNLYRTVSQLSHWYLLLLISSLLTNWCVHQLYPVLEIMQNYINTVYGKS